MRVAPFVISDSISSIEECPNTQWYPMVDSNNDDI